MQNWPVMLKVKTVIALAGLAWLKGGQEGDAASGVVGVE